MKFSNVLITGCGGDIAQSIAKIIKDTAIAKKLIGCDISNEHAGELYFDICEKIPRANDPSYFDSIKTLISKHNIDLIIPISEAEIAQFIKNNYQDEILNTPVVLAPSHVIEIGLDKLNTIKFLKNNKLDYPWTTEVSGSKQPPIPCILKQRIGQGSKGLMIIDAPVFIKYYQNKRPNDLWQELLLPHDEEYTCGLYRSHAKEIRTICIKRKLQGGLTGSGIVCNNDHINNYLNKIADCLNLQGSINVQLRLTSRGPVAFEFNPRFSSTVYFRHLLGFKDLIWSLQEKLHIPLDKYSPPKEGTKIFRGAKEFIIENNL